MGGNGPKQGRKVVWIVLGVVGGLILLWLAVCIIDMLWFAASHKRLIPPGEPRSSSIGLGDKQPSSSDATVSGIPVKSFGKPLTEVDRRAVEQATGWWKLTKLGESHYVYEILSSTNSVLIGLMLQRPYTNCGRLT